MCIFVVSHIVVHPDALHETSAFWRRYDMWAIVFLTIRDITPALQVLSIALISLTVVCATLDETVSPALRGVPLPSFPALQATKPETSAKDISAEPPSKSNLRSVQLLDSIAEDNGLASASPFPLPSVGAIVNIIQARLSADPCLSKRIDTYSYSLCPLSTSGSATSQSQFATTTSVVPLYTATLARRWKWEISAGTSSGQPYRFVSMVGKDGDMCEFTSAPRQAYVSFVCGLTYAISTFVESPKCFYSFVVTLPEACDLSPIAWQVPESIVAGALNGSDNSVLIIDSGARNNGAAATPAPTTVFLDATTSVIIGAAGCLVVVGMIIATTVYVTRKFRIKAIADAQSNDLPSLEASPPASPRQVNLHTIESTGSSEHDHDGDTFDPVLNPMRQTRIARSTSLTRRQEATLAAERASLMRAFRPVSSVLDASRRVEDSINIEMRLTSNTIRERSRSHSNGDPRVGSAFHPALVQPMPSRERRVFSIAEDPK
jgi:hypothetical protein